jgi:glycosyltransferase involved in cell wall biosynthesis
VNILFVNYGDFTTNSLNHIAGFANALSLRGHACTVAVPGGKDSFAVVREPLFTPATYAELLHHPAAFPDGRPADLIHAWTPREGVRKFVLAYQAHAAARLVVHLEDNEEHLIATWTGRPVAELRDRLDAELLGAQQAGLPHPVRYRNLLRLADGVTVIVDALRRFVPAGPPVQCLPPGVDFSLYQPQPRDPALVRELGLRGFEKILVYTGSLTFANEPEIRDLYAAVRLLNRQGRPTRLVRTGFNSPEFEQGFAAEFKDVVLDLGFVEKARLPRLLALADVLVQPGRPGAFNDCRLPSKLPEFLAMGRPVVLPAANVAASMTDGRDALFLHTGTPEEIAAACGRIFADAELAERLARGAPAFARKHFDLAVNTDGLLRFYEAVRARAPRTDWTAGAATPQGDVYLLARQLSDQVAALGAGVPPEVRGAWAEAAGLAGDLARLCRQVQADAGEGPARAALERLEKERAERGEVHQILDAVRRHAAALELARARLESELAQANYEIAETRARALTLGQHSQQELARLRESLGEFLRESVRRREDRIFQREEKIRQMQASASWRITAPLRFLRRRLLDPWRRRPAAPPATPRYDFPAPPDIHFEFQPAEFQPQTPEFLLSVDYPNTWSFPPRTLGLRGWCVSAARRPLRAVRARIDGRTYDGLYGLKRMDVLARFKDLPLAEYCGFKIDLELRQGDAELVLEAGDDAGAWHRFFAVRLHVDQDTGQREITAYENWINVYDRHTLGSMTALAANIRHFARQPLISVLLPVYNTPEPWLIRAVESVTAQAYSRWELCIADDASTAPHVRPVLERFAAADPRIKVVFRETNGHISAASNSALALATGEWVALLDHDDELAPHALYELAALLNARPDTDLVYSDEDKIDKDGHRHSPYFKPDFLPDLFTGQNYLTHLAAYRTALVRELGGFRIGFEGSQDWDLALRYAERIAPERIRHIPKVLYHWRALAGSTALLPDEKTYSVDAARRALGEHFARRGETVELVPIAGGHWRVKHPLPAPPPLVSLIVPTRNGRQLLQRCVDSILEKTTYPAYEILVVDNGSDDPGTLAYLQRLAARSASVPAPPVAVRVLRDAAPFNYSALNNRAVQAARGEIVGLLNNDLEVINGDWLEEMAGQAARPGIGCVGAMLYYPNNTIQHAGVVLGVGGVAAHAFRDLERGREGRFNRARLVQNYSAVTAACLVIRKAVYEQVGGLDEAELAVAFNDIDFCLKVRAAGYRNLWTPFAELYHHESASRGADDTEAKQERFRRETETMLSRWGPELAADPAYNPNLTLELTDFSLAALPRSWRPWQAGEGRLE